MKVQVGRGRFYKNKLLFSMVAVFALIAQPMYGLVSTRIANAVGDDTTNPGTVIVTTADDFQAAINDTSVNHITIGSDFTISSSIVIARSNLTVQGNGHTITGTGEAWTSGGNNYVIKVWNAQNITFNSIKLTGAQAGLLISSSSVELRGHTHVSGNILGGIELTGANPSLVHQQGSLHNSSEEFKKPTVWTDNTTTAVINSTATTLTPVNGLVSGQSQYYLVPSNGGVAATNIAYVSPTGNDNNTGATLDRAFATIQKALDSITENGTVFIADGSYYGTANIKQHGTKLQGITNSRDKVFIYVTPTSGQAGIFANRINNVTIKNLGVYGDNFGSNGALIKLSDGSGARIENVAVKNASVTGININSYENVTVSGVYVNNVAKDGISVIARQSGNPAASHVSKNITLQNSTISRAQWSAIALYVKSGSTTASIKDVVIKNVRTQYGLRGIYLEGAEGATITSPSSDKLILQNVVVGQNTEQYINNQSAGDIDARSLIVNVGGGVEVPVSSMTEQQYGNVRHAVVDKLTNDTYGYVQLRDLAAPVLITESLYIANGENKTLAWHPVVGAVKYEYAEYNNNPPATETTSPSWSKQVTQATTTDTAWKSDVGIYWRVRAIDAAGNVGPWSDTGYIVTDRTKPIVSIDNTTIADGKLSVTVSGTDNLSGLQALGINVYNASNNGPSLVSGLGRIKDNITAGTRSDSVTRSDIDISHLAPGTYTIRAVALDHAGNYSSQILKTIVIEDEAPEIPPSEVWILDYKSNDDGTYTILGSTSHSTDTVRLWRVIDGDYVEIENVVVDADGNWSAVVNELLVPGTTYVFFATTTNTQGAETPVESLYKFTVPSRNNNNDDAQGGNPETPAQPEEPEDPITPFFLPATFSGLGLNDGATTPLPVTPATETDDDTDILGAQDTRTSWSAVNAALAGFIAILALVALAGIRRKETDNNTGARLFMIVPAAAAVIAFFVIEDIGGSMAWFNVWTWLFAGILVVQAILATLTTRTAND